MNKEIELLYKTIEAKDKIINEQALEIARLKGKSEILEENNKLLIQQKQQMYEDLDIAYDKIDKAIEYIKENDLYVYIPDNDLNMDYEELANDKLLELLGDKENE